MGYDEWELKASPIKISELKPKNNLKHDTSSRVLHSPMAATVWFASPGVFALGVAPACPKRTGASQAARGSRPKQVRREKRCLRG
jgi:hypothetical protein